MQCQETRSSKKNDIIELSEQKQRVARATQIFHEYGHEIREIIRFNVRDEGLAEDLYQDLFLSLASANLPPKIQNMRRFLYRVITNDIISMARRTKRRRELMKYYAQDFRSIESEEHGPSENIIHQEQKQYVFSRLEKHLCPSEYKAVVWRFQRGGDNEQAAEELGIKKRSFIRYLSAGLKKIRNLNWTEEGDSA